MKKRILIISMLAAFVGQISAQKTKVEATDKKVKTEATVTVKTVVDKYIAAVGGETAVKNVKTLAVFSKGSVQGQELELAIKSTTDGKQAVDMSIPAMGMVVQKVRITPTSGYMEVQGQRKDFTADELKTKQGQIQPFFELGWANNPEITYVGIEKINDADAYVIKSSKGKIYYDVKTGLKVAMETEANGGGENMKALIYVSDYKEVKGIKYPHKMNIQAGLVPLEFNVTEVKINEGVTDADFQ